MSSNINKYRINKPYPEVRLTAVSPKERAYEVKGLLEDIGGIFGEMTAIAQYIYSDFTLLEDKYEELKDMFEGVAKVEMTHLELLSNVIRDLGVSPRLWAIDDGKYKYWTPRYIEIYATEPTILLREAMKIEREAIDLYRKQSKVIKNASLVALIERIIEDEMLHYETFEKFLREYSKKS